MRDQDLVEAGDRAAARVRFGGRHVAPLLGVPASGREVTWTGAAFFAARANLLTEIWVLGDLAALKDQLQA